MNERDAMRLLANANPVKESDLMPLESPAGFKRRPPSRRLAIAVAGFGAVAAAVAGVFAFNGSASRGLVSGLPPAGSENTGNSHAYNSASPHKVSVGATGLAGPTGSTGPTGPQGPTGSA